MIKSMKLTTKREAIFNKQIGLIKEEALKCFGLLAEFDDLYQLLLINYAVALQKANLKLNFHAFCMKRGMWECYKELNRNKVFNKNHIFLGDIQRNLDYDNLSFNSQNDNRLENDFALNEGVLQIIQLHSRLLFQERLVVNRLILGDKTHAPNVKIRRQQMITKNFKTKVRELLSAA